MLKRAYSLRQDPYWEELGRRHSGGDGSAIVKTLDRETWLVRCFAIEGEDAMRGKRKILSRRIERETAPCTMMGLEKRRSDFLKLGERRSETSCGGVGRKVRLDGGRRWKVRPDQPETSLSLKGARDCKRWKEQIDLRVHCRFLPPKLFVLAERV